MKKIAFVVQRYGTEVNGGSEFLCRLIAERMSRYWDIDVLTSCALDYRTWEDSFAPGLSQVNGVQVRRFRVDFPRNTLLFDRLATCAYSNPQQKDFHHRWAKEQGPYSSDFLRYLESNRNSYDLFFFFTYLYGFTVFGLPIVADRSILIPTAHDEPPIYLSLFEKLFSAPKALFFQTPEERDFVLNRFSLSVPHEVMSTGIDEPSEVPLEEFRKAYAGHLRDPYLLYLGRIDESKGCRQLFEDFIRYRKDHPETRLRLLLAGKAQIPIPNHPDISSLGFIEERFKFAALRGAQLLIMPSSYESLSLVMLEAWLQGTPVLANAKSPVLKGQCQRSGGGLTYENYEEFESNLNKLSEQADLRVKMGSDGQKFVRDHYLWSAVEQGYLKWANRVQ